MPQFPLRAVFALALSVVLAPVCAWSDELDRTIATAQTEMASQLQNIGLQLALYDQINRIQVAQSFMSAGAADAMLSAKAAELVSRVVTQDDIATLQAKHRQTVDAWRTQLTTKISVAARWPDGGEALWRPIAEQALARAWQEYQNTMSRNFDPVAAVAQFAIVQAWTDGDETAKTTVFAGQAKRIANAIPGDLARGMMTASLGLDPATAPSAGQTVAQTQPAPSTSSPSTSTVACLHPGDRPIPGVMGSAQPPPCPPETPVVSGPAVAQPGTSILSGSATQSATGTYTPAAPVLGVSRSSDGLVVVRQIPNGLGPPPAFPPGAMAPDNATPNPGNGGSVATPGEIEDGGGIWQGASTGDGGIQVVQVPGDLPPGTVITYGQDNGPQSSPAVAPRTAVTGTLEPNTDRPGSDYMNFDLPPGSGPSQCQLACFNDLDHCRAFTYVNPGVQGPNARCWLKSTLPQGQPSTCCTSGFAPPPSPPDFAE